MNKTATFTFIVSALVLNAGFAAADEGKIGIVNMQKCIQTSDAGKKAKSEIESAFNKKKKELTDEENAIKKLQEEFQKQASTLSQSAQAEKKAKLQERYMKYQENVQRSQAEIEKKQQEASAPIIQKIRDQVASIAKKKGFTLVLEKNENIVIFTEDKNDITDEVLKGIN